MSKFFIYRPVFAGVIAILFVIAGLVAVAILPVAQYPEIAPPTVVITTNYPGASADTIARSSTPARMIIPNRVNRIMPQSSPPMTRAAPTTITRRKNP